MFFLRLADESGTLGWDAHLPVWQWVIWPRSPARTSLRAISDIEKTLGFGLCPQTNLQLMYVRDLSNLKLI